MPSISKQLVDTLGFCVSACTRLFPVFLCCTGKRSIVFFVYLCQIQYDCAERGSVNLQISAHLFQKKNQPFHSAGDIFFIFDVAMVLPHTLRYSAACGLCACVRLTCANTEQSRRRRLVPGCRGQERLSRVNSCVPRQHSPSISVHWCVPMMTPEKAR